jgi:hypothetical protein
MDEHDWAERYHAGDPVAVWRLWKKAIRIVRAEKDARVREEFLRRIPGAVLERYERERKARGGKSAG